MVNRLRKQIASSLLVLFTIQVLLSFLILLLFEQNHEFQRAQLVSKSTYLETIYLSEKEFKQSYIPIQQELQWEHNFYDIKFFSQKKGVYKVVVLIDKKEKSLANIVKKQNGKTDHKPVSTKVLHVFLAVLENEWRLSPHIEDNNLRYSLVNQIWTESPYFKIAQPPPDYC